MAGKTRVLAIVARQWRHARLAFSGLAAAATLAAMSACTTGSVLNLEPAVDVGARTAAVPQYADMQAADLPAADMQAAELPAADVQAAELPAVDVQDIPPPAPAMTVAYPRLDDPMPPPEQMSPAPMSAEEIDCRKELRRLDVTYVDLPPIHGGGQCGIDHPVKVSAIGSIQMKPAATLTCNMAASFAAWTRKELVPSARWRYFSGVKAIHQGSSYSCRNIAGEGVLSEHGKGNALDVMSIELNNGDDIDVRKPGLFAFRTRGFLNTVRADGCQYFTTVLGPGYNYDHRNHFHFDIKNRRNGYRACR